jgi:hypothetical protein
MGHAATSQEPSSKKSASASEYVSAADTWFVPEDPVLQKFSTVATNFKLARSSTPVSLTLA